MYSIGPRRTVNVKFTEVRSDCGEETDVGRRRGSDAVHYVSNTTCRCVRFGFSMHATFPKAAYVRQPRLGGVVIWELGGDDDRGRLMRAITDALR